MGEARADETVVILAPVGQDAAVLARMLAAQQIRALISDAPGECLEHLGGALLLTEEALELPGATDLLECLRRQPAWSEVPVIILTSGGESRTARLLDLAASAAGSVTLLERPMKPATLLRSVQVALRARRRQYQVRDLIEEQQRTELQLRKSQEALRRSEEFLRLSSQAGGVGVWDLDTRTFECVISPMMAHLIGFGSGQALLKREQWEAVVLPEDLPGLFSAISACLERGAPLDVEFRIRRRDGTIRWVHSQGGLAQDTATGGTHLSGAAFDITERKRSEDALAEAQAILQQHASNLEKAVDERTTALRTANEQLETYVYSVAHDLRAPLRSMSGCSQLLLDDYAVLLGAQGQQLLKRIQNSAEFMDRLLLDLLDYGRTARANIELGPVAVRKAWDAALFQCAMQIEQTQACVETAEPLPVVLAHEATLGQVLANLLSNSLKFVVAGVQPHVRLWAEQRGSLVQLRVRDNGVGIPDEQHERVFRVFERLHGARFPGTGIGLSIAKKGVERMGGRITLESKPGNGSTFCVELRRG